METIEIQNENITGEQDIELHPEEVRGKTDTYTSLTELYGVDIFTYEFKMQKDEIRNNQELKCQEIEKQLFQNWSAEIGIQEDELLPLLFCGQSKEAFLQSYEKETQRIHPGEIAMVGISIAVVIAIYMLFSIEKEEVSDMDITISYGKSSKDFKVNRKQKIEDTIAVLADCGVLPCMPREQYAVFSKRKTARINRHLTYEQAEIYAGDILYLEGQD